MESLLEKLNLLNFIEKPINYQPNFKFKEPFIQENDQQKQNQNNQVLNKLSIISYNILADQYTKESYFPYCKPAFLKFKYRSKLVIKQLQTLNSDIICLQEVDQFYDFYQKEFQQMGYDMYFQPKLPAIQTQYEQFNISYDPKFKEGVLIGWKKEKFELIEKKECIFANFLDKQQEYQFKNRFSYMKEHRGIFCKLRYKENNQEIVVGNFHTYWDPKLDQVKFFQVYQMFKFIQENYKKDDYIFVCGDLNQMPNSNSIKMILEKKKPLQVRNEYSKVHIEECEYFYKKLLDNDKLMYNRMYPEKEKINKQKKSNENIQQQKQQQREILQQYQEKNQSLQKRNENYIQQSKDKEKLKNQSYSNQKTVNRINIISNDDDNEEQEEKDDEDENDSDNELNNNNKKNNQNLKKQDNNENFQFHNFLSSYQNYRKGGRHPQYTTYTQGFTGCLDYIFYNNNNKIKVDNFLELYDEQNKFNKNFCPNQYQPSDHLPLLVNFSLF